MKKFFILSMGRAGTKMLSTLLDLVPRAIVRHEPDKMDVKLIGLRNAGCFDLALDGLLEQRFQRVLPNDSACEIYGEVNSYLRYESDWLRDRLDAQVLFVCRDGRDFVRSAYGRAVYTDLDGQMMIVPKDHDPAARNWAGYDRFERLCWYWAHTNEILLDRVGHPIQMERVLSEYEYFEERILSPLEIRIDRDLWAKEVSRPRNTSRSNARRDLLKDLVRFKRPVPRPSLPRWTEWNREQDKRFWEIAGSVMERLGYADRPAG